MTLNLVNLIKILKLFPKKLILSLFIFLNLFYGTNYANFKNNHKLKIIFKDKPVINLEIADTDEKRKLGLMFRKNLNRNDGIIFDYKGMNYVKIWMKNTQIPLDIIFLQNNEIVYLKENVLPCLNNKLNCPTYGSEKPINFIIEVNAGIIEDYELKVGDKLLFD